MRAKAKPRRKRIRKRKAISRATLKPYIRELERAKVPPNVVAQAATMMNILLGGRGNQ
jgi:hypothetical protein